jgi:acetyl esterase/lipase
MRTLEYPAFLLAVLGSVALATPSTAEEKTKKYAVTAKKHLTYYDGEGQDKVKHKLDLYLPKGLKNYPVLLFVHGGGWVHGDKGEFFGLYGWLARSFVRKGIGVAVVNYRLSPKVKHPEHIKDVARAFAWVHKNIGKHGGRKDRLFVCGHSAGGHLVSLLTTDASYLKAHGLKTSAIHGVIPISGPFFIPDGAMPRVFGTEKGSGKKASPLTHVRKGLPPFLVVYAEKELPGCGEKAASAFCKALKAKGVDASTTEMKGNNHLNIIFNAGRPDNMVHKTIVGFIRKHSGK